MQLGPIISDKADFLRRIKIRKKPDTIEGASDSSKQAANQKLAYKSRPIKISVTQY